MKDFLTKACSKMQGVQYMENKSYQLRYLPIFEIDLLSTVNYITNVLKKERVSILSDLCEELCGILCGYRECYGSKATDI